MPVSSGSEREPASAQPPLPQTEVTVCESRPGRRVFLEDGNTEGWIATDVVVELRS